MQNIITSNPVTKRLTLPIVFSTIYDDSQYNKPRSVRFKLFSRHVRHQLDHVVQIMFSFRAKICYRSNEKLCLGGDGIKRKCFYYIFLLLGNSLFSILFVSAKEGISITPNKFRNIMIIFIYRLRSGSQWGGGRGERGKKRKSYAG